MSKKISRTFQFRKTVERKKLEAALALLETLIFHCDWGSNRDDQETVKLCILKTRAANIQNRDDTDSFKDLKTKFKLILKWNEAKKSGSVRTPVDSPITTIQIRLEEQADLVARICKSWAQTMKPFLDIVKAPSVNLSQEEKELIFDTQDIIESISRKLDEAPAKGRRAYVAFSEERIEGIAIQNNNVIELLCTNPYNLPLYGLAAAPTRGAGTALVTHIAHAILSKTSLTEKGIRLTSLGSARPFYKKLGFREGAIHEDPANKNTFSMSRHGCEELLRKKPERHTIGSAQADQLQALNYYCN